MKTLASRSSLESILVRIFPHRLLPPQIHLMLVLATALIALFLAWAPSAGALVLVDACGYVVEPGEQAYLTRDLDCRASRSEGVVLSDGSVLHLGGHLLVGDPAADSGAWQGVRCQTGSRCAVVGPGTITGFSASGVAGTRVRLREVVVTGNGRAGVAAYENVRLRDVVIDGNGTAAVHAGGRVKIARSTVEALDGFAVIEQRRPLYRPDPTRCSD